jgi:SynChlorMet cassette protein ScmC
MPVDNDPPVAGTGIRLANGQQWRFCPTDTESDALIQRLAGIMQLVPITSGTELFVTVRDAQRIERYRLPAQDPLICILLPGTDAVMKMIQLTDLAKMVAFETLPAGGLLIHGALAERDGQGVILAAPGGTGKSTASNRLPLPWRSLSDDATLVVRDRDGQFIAHPWPTWSRFTPPSGPGGTWNVERGIPLRAIFFLSQSPEDRAVPLDTNESSAFLMESVHQAMGAISRAEFTQKEAEYIYDMEIAAVSALAGSIPAHLLHISLTGRFWDVIGPVLDDDLAGHPAREARFARPAASSDSPVSMFGAGHIPIVYTGPSMNPTLQTPDLLEVEPCGNRKPVAGDVICFYSPEKDRNVVHRVIGISGAGLRTRGDNNPAPDPDPVTPDLLIGRVVSAWRENHDRPIPGGHTGMFVHRWLRTRKAALQRFGWFIRLGRPVLVVTRGLARVLPGRYQPRIVLYSSRHKNILRLFFGSSVAGEFSETRGWIVRYPFRLLVNIATLPTIDRPPKRSRISAVQPSDAAR